MAQGQDISRGEVERLDRSPVDRQVDRQWEARAGAVTPLDRMLVRLALARLGDPGCAVVLWDGDELSPPLAPVRFRVTVKSRRALLELCWDAASRFGDLFGRREVEVEGDLAKAMAEVNRIPDSAPGRFLRPAAPLVPPPLCPPLWERYARAQGAARVRRHYDLGNDFYRLWLDRDTMPVHLRLLSRAGAVPVPRSGGRIDVGQSLIEFRGVSLGYGATPILHNLSFTIEEGDFFAAVGPNGAGKTTILRAILRILVPRAGEIRLANRAASPLAFGYVPQERELDPIFPLTAQEIVLMGRTKRLGPWRRWGNEDRRIAVRSLEEAGIAHLARSLSRNCPEAKSSGP